MDFTQMGTVLAIVVICYLIGMAVKLCRYINNDAIPVIVGMAGGILGVIGMCVMPDFPADDVLNALAIGITSGLASTGANQTYKFFND